jgi:hypothetical protein
MLSLKQREPLMAHDPVMMCFPESFPFYSGGNVEPLDAKAPSTADSLSLLVLFRLRGDELSYCTVAFERTPRTEDELSELVELANILASKLATQLIDTLGEDVEISAPEVILPNQHRHDQLLKYFRNAAASSASRCYVFHRTAPSQLPGKTILHLVYAPGQSGRA